MSHQLHHDKTFDASTTRQNGMEWTKTLSPFMRIPQRPQRKHPVRPLLWKRIWNNEPKHTCILQSPYIFYFNTHRILEFGPKTSHDESPVKALFPHLLDLRLQRDPACFTVKHFFLLRRPKHSDIHQRRHGRGMRLQVRILWQTSPNRRLPERPMQGLLPTASFPG